MNVALAVPVSILDAIVIYLSVGAPFGVLRFFSDHDKRRSTSLLFAALSIVGWPYAALKLVAPFVAGQVDPTPEISSSPAELFVISGHPHPELASICYRRARRKVILGRTLGKLADTSEILHTDPDLSSRTTGHPVPALEQTIDAGSRSFRV